MPKVSIVMPSLNVSRYIGKCMDSVIRQTLEDIEIIAVDAGSTDGTLEILKQYAQRDKRITLISADRKSYGYQMNLGIAAAKGAYIGFVETDDYIVPDMYEVLYNACIENNVDFAKGYTMQFHQAGNQIYTFENNTFHIREKIANQVLNPSRLPQLFLKDRFLWLGLYKSGFVKQIRLNETPSAAFQDVGFQLQVLSKAQSAIYLDKPIYFYRQDNSGSSIHSTKSISYIVEEYNRDKRFLAGKELEWYTVFYTRMFDQLNSRFQVMAKGARFWSEADSQIDTIRGQLQEAVRTGYLSEMTMGEERWRKLQMLMSDRESIYEEYYREYAPAIAEIRGLLELIGDNQTVIFGAGKQGCFLKDILRKKGKDIIAFCDNKAAIQHTSIDGVPVFSPEEAAVKYRNGAVFVVANTKHAEEMKLQLVQNAVSSEKIGIYTLGVNMLLLTL